MRIVPHDLSVLAGAGLGFVGIDDEVMRAPVALLGHEGPFEPSREAGPAASAQPRGLHLVDDEVAALVDEEFRPVPIAALARRSEVGAVPAVEIGEDAVLIGEHARPPPSLPCRVGTTRFLAHIAARGEDLGLADPILPVDAAREG